MDALTKRRQYYDYADNCSCGEHLLDGIYAEIHKLDIGSCGECVHSKVCRGAEALGQVFAVLEELNEFMVNSDAPRPAPAREVETMSAMYVLLAGACCRFELMRQIRK